MIIALCLNAYVFYSAPVFNSNDEDVLVYV